MTGGAWRPGDEPMRQPPAEGRPTQPPPKPSDMRCPVCGGARVIHTDRPGATSPRPCPLCDPYGVRLSATSGAQREPD